MLLDFASTPAAVSRRVPCVLWSWMVRPPRRSVGGTTTRVVGAAARCSSAAAMVMTLPVLPGS